MSRTLLSILLLVIVATAPACDRHGHAPDDVAEGGHGHDHGPGDDHAHDGAEDGRPTVAVTHWTDRTELFMEYPVMVAGSSGRSAIHVTELANFSPVPVGEAVVVLRDEQGQVLEFSGRPSRPGIFGVTVRVDRPGEYEMSVRIDTPVLQDVHELGAVKVHGPDETLDAHGSDEADAISFLKEQQWTLEFGTTQAEVRPLRSGLTVPAVVRPRPGGEAALTAPVPGRIDTSAKVPLPGSRVRAGAVLARILPHSDDLRDAPALRAALVEAEQQHLLATRERDRVDRLVEARAIPARRLDEAAAELAAAAARLEASRARWARYEALSQSSDGGSGSDGFLLRAPFAGVVADVGFAPGAGVEQDQLLVRLVDADRVHVVGAVPESQAAALASVQGAELLSGDSPPVALGRPLAVGRIVEPVTRTTEVRFPFDNRQGGLRIGQSVRLRLLIGEGEARLAVPASAVVDDGGSSVVFVQTGGESFDRRPVVLGSRADDFVHVLEGVEPWERVVHRGAYLVRLAAMSTRIPAHGHVH